MPCEGPSIVWVQSRMQSALRLHFLQQGPFPCLRGHLGEGIPGQVLQDVLLGHSVQLNLLLQQLRNIPACMSGTHPLFDHTHTWFSLFYSYAHMTVLQHAAGLMSRVLRATHACQPACCLCFILIMMTACECCYSAASPTEASTDTR